MIEVEEKYMRRALQLACNGAGNVSPNPMVGAVIVAGGKIIGEGWHRKFGQGHAEVNAVASVSDRSLLRDCTVYVTLEPCSHYGKTPPCAKLLVDCGVPRVVVGCVDPFREVSGRGVKMLRDAGVEVAVGVLEDECRQLNRRFFTAHTTGMPWVLLKWAQTADGFIDRFRNNSAEEPVVISTPLTRLLVHRERSLCDAIVVGANTVRLDNPSLDNRYWSGNSPLRVVLDRRLSLPATSRVLTDGRPTIIYNAVRDGSEGAVTYVKLNTDEPATWLRDLYSRGVTSVMVEGGAAIIGYMVAAGAWNEARIETSPIIAGTGIVAPRVDGEVVDNLKFGDNYVNIIANHVKKP
jgi:diaminohydroxyphosphoribosylaminopyrimidine deaminase/5-amino-6-(5-phosphoribosylamino)uracil reductase